MSSRERMVMVLDLLYDLLSRDTRDCPACRGSAADRCPPHARDLDAARAANAGIGAVEYAATEADAAAAYRACLDGLVGIGVGTS